MLDRRFYMGLVKRTALILAIFAVFAAAELYFHWYAGTQKTSAAQHWKSWYLFVDPQNGKPYHRGELDWNTPGAFLGFLVGIVLARSQIWIIELVLWAMLFSGGILALIPHYLAFFPELDGEMAHATFGIGYIIGVLHCGFFIAVGRILASHFLDRKSRKASLLASET